MYVTLPDRNPYMPRTYSLQLLIVPSFLLYDSDTRYALVDALS